MAKAKYRTEDVASTPRGWRVRTTTAGPHMVRIAFPPGPRRKGSGRVVQILHPKGENPACNQRKLNPLLESILGGAAAGTAVVAVQELIKRRQKKGNPSIFAFPRTEVLGGGRTRSSWGLYEGAADSPFNKYLGDYEKRGKALVRIGSGRGPKRLTTSKVRFRNSKETKKRRLSVPEKHQIKIAKQTLRMPDPILGVMGGMTKKLAREILRKYKISFKENPNDNGAAELYRDFHGRGPKEVLDLQEACLAAGDYAALGDMGGLWFQPVKGDPGKWPLPSIEFEKRDGVKLAASPDNTQLYLIGGNQVIPLDDLRAMGLDTSKQLIAMGLVYAISYVTEKKFDGFKTGEYAHQFGEETGEIPMALYDRQAKRIALVGGAYSIAPPSKKLGASPGIEN